MFKRGALVALGCTSLLVARVESQPPIPERDLSAAYRTYAAQFTDIGYALPLANGSLMVADFGEMTLTRLDGRTGVALSVGRKGSGPKEYQVAGQLLRLPGDTIAMYDAAQLRMLLVTAEGEPIRTVTLSTDRRELLTLPQAFATDARGRIYAHVFARPVGAARDSATSRIDVVRMQNLASSKYDTLATLWFERLPLLRKPLADSQTLRVSVNLASLSPSDAAVVARDGTLRVIRGDEYRVEFIDENGTLQREVRVPGARYPLLPEERLKIVQETRDQTAKGTAHARRLLDARTPIPRVVIGEPDEWPAQKPYFQLGARLSDNGWLYIPVSCAEPDRQCLDVLNPDGVRHNRYRLPKHARFVTASDQFVFVVLRDEDDLETVVAYRAQ